MFNRKLNNFFKVIYIKPAFCVHSIFNVLMKLYPMIVDNLLFQLFTLESN